MKYSLHIGINIYPDTDSNLDGCVNDANDWQEELEKRGFITSKLLDAEATKESIITKIKELIAKTKRDDIAVITYSGHGTWVVDEDGDEVDGRDEALCPYDVAKGNIIVDDELYEIFSRRNWGARVIFISDSCHSGSVNMVSHTMPGVDGGLKFPKIRYLAPEVYLKEDREAIIKAKGVAKSSGKWSIRATSLLLTACRDMEYSYDAWFNGRANGAFTYTALNALKSLDENASYQDWYREIRKYLPNIHYPQTPQIVATRYQKYSWKVFKE